MSVFPLREPPDPAAIEEVVDLAAAATFVGLGTSTREGHETFAFVEEVTFGLVDRGFRVLALRDGTSIGRKYDAYVTGADLDLDTLVSQAWGPWQTVEMREALQRVRRRNQEHPEDPVRILGVDTRRPLLDDYDQVERLAAELDPAAGQQVRQRLATVRGAHHAGEHVLRKLGTHPGKPFVQTAREVEALVAGLPEGEQRREALRLMDSIVAFHANAIGEGYDQAREEAEAARVLLDHHARTGHRIVYWDGSLHVVANQGASVGRHLRVAVDQEYVAVHLTFRAGQVPRFSLPPARRGSLDDLVTRSGRTTVWDLRRNETPVDGAGPIRTRIVSGMYLPEEDAQHYVELPDLRESLDVVVGLPDLTPVTELAT